MIDGFEEFTEDVTDNDLEMINLIAKSLSKRIGVTYAITNAEMRKAIFLHYGTSLSSAKMRKYIQYIRAYKLVSMLCASSKGYWVAKDKEEWIKYRESFRQRVRSMVFTLKCMESDNPGNNIA